MTQKTQAALIYALNGLAPGMRSKTENLVGALTMYFNDCVPKAGDKSYGHGIDGILARRKRFDRHLEDAVEGMTLQAVEIARKLALQFISNRKDIGDYDPTAVISGINKALNLALNKLGKNDICVPGGAGQAQPEQPSEKSELGKKSITHDCVYI